MLSKMESPGVTNIETGDQRYSQTGSGCSVCNINGRAMLPDSTVIQLSQITIFVSENFRVGTVDRPFFNYRKKLLKSLNFA